MTDARGGPPPGMREGAIRRRGRLVAWAEVGRAEGRPVVVLPGTPGCRYGIRSDHTEYLARDLRMIITERPGFGTSTRLPGHGFVEPADDVAAILDDLGIERTHLWAGSGGTPYALAFAQRHPDRVVAIAVVSGSAPVTDEELADVVPMNAEFAAAAGAGDLPALLAAADRWRQRLVDDPLGGFRSVMASAPPEDRAVMEDPGWQADLVRIVRESLRQGPDGWTDELLALRRRWDDIDLKSVHADITWWHAEADRNVPFSAARRVIDHLPNARWMPLEPGHLAGYHRYGEILDELLTRPATS